MTRRLLPLVIIAAAIIGAGFIIPAKRTPAAGIKHSATLRSGLSSVTFEDSVNAAFDALRLAERGLSYEIFRYAMIGFHSLREGGKAGAKNILTIIDFSQNSTRRRFYTIDLDKGKVLFQSLVSHGRNTGENEARHFSNRPHSNQSSLGFYLTGETYVGSKGYSLRLDGLDPAYNDKIRERAVVIHDAAYVSEDWIRRYGRLGRSQGCPALPKEISRQVIDTIKDKTVVFAYFNDEAYLQASAHLDVDALFDKLDAPVLAGVQVR